MGMENDKREDDINVTALLEEIVQTTILAVELFSNDYEAAQKWMTKDSELLFGKTPIEAIMSNDGKFLIQWLRDRLGKEDED